MNQGAGPVLVSKSEDAVLRRMIIQWQSRGIVAPEVARRLSGTFKPVSFQWERLAMIFGIACVLCAFISVMSVLVDERVLELIMLYLRWLLQRGPAVRATVAFLISGTLFFWGCWRKRKYRHNFATNEMIFIGAAFVLFFALTQLEFAWRFYRTKAVDRTFDFLPSLEHDEMIRVWLQYSFIAGTLGFVIPAPSVWFVAIHAFAVWLGMATGYAGYWRAYYIGMSQPQLFVCYGGILVLLGQFMRHCPKRYPLYVRERCRVLDLVTRIMGNLYLFISLWILSLDYDFVWAIAWGVAAVLSIVYGLRTGEQNAVNFGQIFLILNLYTRFYEIFWDSIHKALFFFILSLSFGLLCKLAQDKWKSYRKTVLDEQKHK